ncbi:hypothetical protein SAMN06265337_0256 [Hymenobacter gelipurpurascens]|uniref:Copper chaperone CopZ n=1 Tax=Hymenobacter gelipurpurascens TaxID=89968 RepID=A0A212T310_9BACT|nr:hypothetical protein [Hymenobacter gelipurpurascens]SNC60422.1 hypothetical protein SAMN06265337_0256 [Hymenobacter gelipurpurascens]
MAEPTPNTNPMQLIRYVLQIEPMQDAESIGQVRQLLTGLGLLVDRIEAGEAEVTTASSSTIGQDDMRHALEEAGFTVLNATAENG